MDPKRREKKANIIQSKAFGSSGTYRRIYSVVGSIPKGRVATYGQIAAIAGCSGARQVGYALHALPEGHPLPWHRVINAQGKISLRQGSDSHEIQRLLLEAEGVGFDRDGRIALKRYRWNPKLPAPFGSAFPA